MFFQQVDELDLSVYADVQYETLSFVDRVMQTALQLTDARGQAIIFKANVVRDMARVMDMTSRQFNDIFRDGKTKVGQRFTEVWQEYRQYHLQIQPSSNEVRALSDMQKVLNHIMSDFGKYTLLDRVPAASERGHWSPLDWNAWIVHELFKLTYKMREGPLHNRGIKAEMAYQIVWSLRANRLYHDKEKKVP